jgi:hypothetical protein
MVDSSLGPLNSNESPNFPVARNCTAPRDTWTILPLDQHYASNYSLDYRPPWRCSPIHLELLYIFFNILPVMKDMVNIIQPSDFLRTGLRIMGTSE